MLFYSLHPYLLFFSYIFQAHELVDKGGDWRSRNKLKAYEAIYCLAVRDYSRAADLFIDCVSTFESYELVDFGMLSFNLAGLKFMRICFKKYQYILYIG